MNSCRNKAKRNYERLKLLSIQILLFIMFLVIWELSARLKIINEFLISKPTSIINLLYQYIISNELFKHIYISVVETLLGLIIGSLVGIIIASILWYFDYLMNVLNPFLVILNALPKTALAPIMIIWAGTGVTGVVIY